MKFSDRVHCIVPWSSFALFVNGEIRPCVARVEDSTTAIYGNIKHQTFEEIWQSENAQKVRRAHLEDRGNIDACLSCIARERKNRNMSSRRIQMRKQFGDFVEAVNPDPNEIVNPKDIVHLDLAFSSTCNLICTTCSSFDSSSWGKWDEKVKELKLEDFDYAPTETTGYENVRSNMESLFPYIQNLRVLILKGGEPFLSKDALWFLEELVQRGIAKNCSLLVVTNGSIFNPKIESLLREFRYVEILVSVDGLGDLFSNIRGGRKVSFEQVEVNIDRFQSVRDDLNPVITPTLQAYNLLKFSEIVEHYTNKGMRIALKNWVVEPVYQSLVSIPEELIPLGIAQLEEAKSIIKGSSDEMENTKFLNDMIQYLSEPKRRLEIHRKNKTMKDQFLRYTAMVDRERGINLHDLIPEFGTYTAK